MSTEKKAVTPAELHCGVEHIGCHGRRTPATCSCDCIGCHNAFLLEAKIARGGVPL